MNITLSDCRRAVAVLEQCHIWSYGDEIDEAHEQDCDKICKRYAELKADGLTYVCAMSEAKAEWLREFIADLGGTKKRQEMQ